jgi:hypothetical protein
VASFAFAHIDITTSNLLVAVIDLGDPWLGEARGIHGLAFFGVEAREDLLALLSQDTHSDASGFIDAALMLGNADLWLDIDLGHARALLAEGLPPGWPAGKPFSEAWWVPGGLRLCASVDYAPVLPDARYAASAGG